MMRNPNSDAFLLRYLMVGSMENSLPIKQEDTPIKQEDTPQEQSGNKLIVRNLHSERYSKRKKRRNRHK